jgi:hypothetical protein
MPGARLLPAILWLAVLAVGPADRAGAEELSARLLADSADGKLDQFDLFSAALIAGGVSDEGELADCHKRLSDALAGCTPAALVEMATDQRAETLVRILHKQVLVGRYDREATDLRITLDRGDYNCLSALVLFAELCRQADIELEFCALSGHVYCRLAGDPHGRIEPTRREPAPPPPTAATSPAEPRSITPIELLGRFYYNRGVACLAAHEYALGIELLRTACRLDPRDSDARANLLAGLNNWALALLAADETAAATRLIEIGLVIDPTFAPLQANAEYVRQQQLGGRRSR